MIALAIYLVLAALCLGLMAGASIVSRGNGRRDGDHE